MATLDTNRKDVTRERLIAARNGVHDLQRWLGAAEEALGRAIEENDGNALSIFWASEIIAKSLSIYNEIARCNGASLVRTREAKAKS